MSSTYPWRWTSILRVHRPCPEVEATTPKKMQQQIANLIRIRQATITSPSSPRVQHERRPENLGMMSQRDRTRKWTRCPRVHAWRIKTRALISTASSTAPPVLLPTLFAPIARAEARTVNSSSKKRRSARSRNHRPGLTPAVSTALLPNPLSPLLPPTSSPSRPRQPVITHPCVSSMSMSLPMPQRNLRSSAPRPCLLRTSNPCRPTMP